MARSSVHWQVAAQEPSHLTSREVDRPDLEVVAAQVDAHERELTPGKKAPDELRAEVIGGLACERLGLPAGRRHAHGARSDRGVDVSVRTPAWPAPLGQLAWWATRERNDHDPAPEVEGQLSAVRRHGRLERVVRTPDGRGLGIVPPTHPELSACLLARPAVDQHAAIGRERVCPGAEPGRQLVVPERPLEL